jgi:putative exosortase-associated protein (TIGR04073 family)
MQMKFGKTLLLAAVLAFGSLQVQAVQDGDNWLMWPLEKLGRGIANCAFGPAELPMKWYDVSFQSGGIVGLTYGTLKGVAYVIGREVIGIVDIITFPFPLPNCPNERDGYGAGYGPIFRIGAEWVVDADHDWWNFVYDRNTMSSVSDY